MKNKLINWWPVIFISLLTIFVWHKIVYQVPLGEGFYYFDQGQYFIHQGRLADLTMSDTFAKFIPFALSPFFVDNIYLYMAFQLFGMVMLNLTLYWVTNYFSKNKWISLIATVLFSVSYIAQFEMLGTANYNRFSERIPPIYPCLIALVLLSKYLDTKRIFYYLASLLVFIFGITIGHFGSFFVPVFMVFPLITYLSSRDKKFGLVSSALLSVPYVVINQLLIAHDNLKPTLTLTEFIANKGLIEISYQILLQFGHMTLPVFLIERISAVSNPFTATIAVLGIPVLIVLIANIFLIAKKIPKALPIYLTSLAVIPIFFFFNLYLGKTDAAFDMRGYQYYFLPSYYLHDLDLTQVKGDRYYLVPFLFFSIMVSFLWYALLKERQKIFKLTAVTFLSLYLIYNTSLIWHNFNQLQIVSDITRSYINYAASQSDKYTNDSVILVPRTLAWPSPFIRRFYAKPGTQYVLFTSGWENDPRLKNRNNVFVYDYDYVGQKVLDLTEIYRITGTLPLPKEQ